MQGNRNVSGIKRTEIFFYALTFIIFVVAIVIIARRVFRSFSHRTKVRKTAQMTRKCLQEIESEAIKLRILRQKSVDDELESASTSTSWAEEKKKFISIRLLPILEDIRSDNDRAVALDRCAKFLEFIASSPASGQSEGAPKPRPLRRP